MPVNLRARMLAAVAALALLHGCGGSSDSGGDGAVRLVNASDAFASLDLYTDDTQRAEAIASGSASDYVSLGAGTYTFELKRGGSSTDASTSERSVLAGNSHTLVAYSTADSLRTVLLTDDEEAPSSGSAKLRAFNASTEAGTLDVYVVPAGASFDDASASTSGLAAERIGSYNEFSAGRYHVRVTGNGDPSDLRLDLPSVTLADQQIATLVLTATPGGVLVHGLLIEQKDAVTAQRNTAARLRLVAGASGNGTVSASVNGGVIAGALRSPAVGSYQLVDAGATTFSVSVDGSSVPVAATTLVAGSDNTLLVTGSAGSASATLLGDDNRPALSSTSARLRLVHGIGDLAFPITLTADYSAVATDIATGQASTPLSVVAGSDFRLEVTTPVLPGPLFLATDVALQATHVYTLFMLGDGNAPLGVLRRDR